LADIVDKEGNERTQVLAEKKGWLEKGTEAMREEESDL
jgi:hypothetical protein